MLERSGRGEFQRGEGRFSNLENLEPSSVAHVLPACKSNVHSFGDLRTETALSIQLLNVKRSDSLGVRSDHFYSAFVQINVGALEPVASFC